MQTAKTLDDLLQQSYDIFDIYGKKPEQLENVTMAFMDVLAPYTQEQITQAFRTWLHRKSKFPTPAEIKNIIEKGDYYQDPKMVPVLLPEWTLQLIPMLGENVVKAWFSDAHISTCRTKIYAATGFKRNWIQEKYKHQLKAIGIDEVLVK